MLNSKFVLFGLMIALIGLSACSSSSGEGSPPPRDKTVIVQPNSSGGYNTETTTSH